MGWGMGEKPVYTGWHNYVMEAIKLVNMVWIVTCQFLVQRNIFDKTDEDGFDFLIKQGIY
jgi:hypothetical protein